MSDKERHDRRTRITGYIIMLPFALYLIGFVAHENGCFKASATEAEEILAEEEKIDLNPLFESESGMPCENREQFMRWYEEYEQAAMEEVDPVADETATCEEESVEADTQSEAEAEVVATVAANTISVTLYQINGDVIDPEIQRKLHDALERYGIGYWFEGSLAQMYQESHGISTAVNQNNLEDMGLYQYKIYYWNWEDGDIFDVDAQIDRYCREMAARFNSGLSVDEAISRHNTSDFVPEVNWQYVAEVKQHLNTMRKVD